MLPFLLAAMVISRIKGYKPFYIFKTYTIYPFIGVEILFWIMQILVSSGYDETVKFASILKLCYFACLLIPVLKFKLYEKALLGSGLVIIGSLMNRVVMNANGGKMPVYFTISKFTGFANEDLFNATGSIHIKMMDSTKLKFLADYLDFGYCVMSLGDIVMKAYFIIIFYQMIKILNENVYGKKVENAN